MSDAVILHRPTQSHFKLWREGTRHLFEWAVVDGPDSGAVIETRQWQILVDQLGDWAQEVQYVADVPDFWVELRQVPEILAVAQAADASNAPFTPHEQDEIARRLDEVKQLVRDQFELTSEQLAALDQRVNEVKEEAKHQGRKTWLYTFYGAVMSTFMTDEIPPHVIQTIVTTMVHGIAHIFGIGGPPPVIST